MTHRRASNDRDLRAFFTDPLADTGQTTVTVIEGYRPTLTTTISTRTFDAADVCSGTPTPTPTPTPEPTSTATPTPEPAATVAPRADPALTLSQSTVVAG